jgi:hypothetical protein
MDQVSPALPVAQRAAHYRDQADKMRKMAATEPLEGMRARLSALADQYQALADSLNWGIR